MTLQPHFIEGGRVRGFSQAFPIIRTCRSRWPQNVHAADCCVQGVTSAVFGARDVPIERFYPADSAAQEPMAPEPQGLCSLSFLSAHSHSFAAIDQR